MTAGHEHGFRRKAVQAKNVSNLQALEAVWRRWPARARLEELNVELNSPSWKITRAKMQKLIRQGFVDGGACGCGAGGFVLTLAGRAELSRLREVEASRKVMTDA